MKKKKNQNINKSINIAILAIIIVILFIVIAVTLVINEDNKTSHFGTSNDIKIRYAYGIGVATIEQKNEIEPYLDIVTITPKNNDLKKLKEAIKNNDFILDKSIESTGVAGEYELTIGDEVVFFDQEKGIYTKNNTNFYKIDISTELFDVVSDIVFEYVNSKQEKIKSSQIYMKNEELGEATFTDKNKVKDIINFFRYTKLKSNIDDLEFEDYYIDFNNGITITTYKNSNIARYTNNTTGEVTNILLYTDPTEYLRNYLTDQIALDDALNQ